MLKKHSSDFQNGIPRCGHPPSTLNLTMTLSVTFELPPAASGEAKPETRAAKRIKRETPPKRLEFQTFPAVWLPYKTPEEIAPDDRTYTRLSVTDLTTGNSSDVCLHQNDLSSQGIDPTALNVFLQHTPHQLSPLMQLTNMIQILLYKAIPHIQKHFIQSTEPIAEQHIPHISQKIVHFYALTKTPQRLSAKDHGLPAGICISEATPKHIFIDVKKSEFQRGSFCKVKKAWWLNQKEIVARKVLVSGHAEYHDPEKEKAALELFRDQRGIIPLIHAGKYNGKWTVFLPLYESDLITFLNLHSASLTQKLLITSQWLDGLATISTHGIHGDINPTNLLLNPGAVISDFGAFRLYGQEQYDLTTAPYASPEYLLKQTVTSKQDVWAMGLCLYLLFTKNLNIPFAHLDSEYDTKVWLLSLKPHWILSHSWPDDIPEFILDLINNMLHPDPTQRLSAEQAFQQFSNWDSKAESSELPAAPDSFVDSLINSGINSG